MKACPLCDTTFGDRVDFCFHDGAPLVKAVVPAPAPAPPPAPVDPASGSASAFDAPDPGGFSFGAPGDPFDAPEPRFARSTTGPVAPVPVPDVASDVAPDFDSVTDAPDAVPDPSAVGVSEADASRKSSGLVRPPPPPSTFPRRAPAPEPAPAPVPAPEPAPAPAPAPPPQPAAAPPAAPAHIPYADDEDAGSGSAKKLVWLAFLAILIVLGGAWYASRPAPEPIVTAPAPKVRADPPKPAPVVAPPPKPTPPAPPPPEAPPPEVPVPVEAAPAPVEPVPTPAPAPTPKPAPKPDPRPAPPAPTPTPAPEANPWSAPEAATSGVLSVTSTPGGATVFLDNAPIGKTPLQREAPFGGHVLRVELAGFHDEARQVELASGSMSVPFELRAVVVTGEVHIFGTPGYTVLVDGEEIGNIPVTAKLSEGTHRFEAISPAGERSSVSRDIQFDGSRKAVTVTIGPQ